MAKKQASSGKLEEKRYLSDGECKKAAARISEELRNYPEHVRLFQQRQSVEGHVAAPVVPLWGPDYETVTAKVERLYHPEEAALIVANITP